jgi:HK97 family phage prohead protease
MIVEGYAALFGVEDQMGDIVRAGAFAASLATRSDPLPMLVEHEPRLLAGYWTDAFEDGRGLFLRGEVRADQPGAARARRMIARGVDGLSIGFVPLMAHAVGSVRVLSEIELLEVSIVTHPMQPQARLTLARGFARAA